MVMTRTRVTLLPIVAALATVSIALRAPNVVEAVERMVPSVNRADAQESNPAAPKAPVAPPAAAPAGPAQGSNAPDIGTFDPNQLTAGELDVLQNLSKRRAELDARAKELDGRDALIAASEARIDQKLAEVKAAEAHIAAMQTQQNQEQTAQVDRLVKIYEAMKPADAANIFNSLDMAILLEVAGRMKEAKIAPVLAAMSPDRAKALTVQLATRRGDDPAAAAGASAQPAAVPLTTPPNSAG